MVITGFIIQIGGWNSIVPNPGFRLKMAERKQYFVLSATVKITFYVYMIYIDTT